jgi:RNA polymerase sigma-70 factor (ECF subfamily)
MLASTADAEDAVQETYLRWHTADRDNVSDPMAAFLLHDAFDFSFSEVATALERSETASRQLPARARAHVRAARPRGTAASPRSGQVDAKHAQLMSAFATATQSGDLNALTQLLASDVRVVTDGGGKVRAASNVIDGADRVAQFQVDATRSTRAVALDFEQVHHLGWADTQPIRLTAPRLCVPRL